MRPTLSCSTLGQHVRVNVRCGGGAVSKTMTARLDLYARWTYRAIVWTEMP